MGSAASTAEQSALTTAFSQRGSKFASAVVLLAFFRHGEEATIMGSGEAPRERRCFLSCQRAQCLPAAHALFIPFNSTLTPGTTGAGDLLPTSGPH